jgi:signal transduction histidine kinase
LFAFFADLTQENTLAFGMFYIPLVCTAVFHRSVNAVWWLTGLACMLSIVGALFPNVDVDSFDLVINRALSIAAILATALFVGHGRAIHEQLAEQTKRAEAAERVKTNVLANVSQEIRTPLYSMVGLLELMMADCRPDQRLPLGQVQGAGRHLLASIENLIDLTRVDQQELRVERLDLAALSLQAAEAVRASAAQQQISIELEFAIGVPAMAMGDTWAARRIIDNLVSNAIKFSLPGSSVRIWIETAPDIIAVVIRDHGIGMPHEVLRRLGEPFFQALSSTGTGAGLALSRCLAETMGATLVFASEPGSGTTATLRMRI